MQFEIMFNHSLPGNKEKEYLEELGASLDYDDNGENARFLIPIITLEAFKNIQLALKRITGSNYLILLDMSYRPIIYLEKE